LRTSPLRFCITVRSGGFGSGDLYVRCYSRITFDTLAELKAGIAAPLDSCQPTRSDALLPDGQLFANRLTGGYRAIAIRKQTVLFLEQVHGTFVKVKNENAFDDS
jgi:hypothetical protein